MSRTAIPKEDAVAPARRPHLGALASSALRHQSDERLVALTRAGSERAFAEIMRRYQRALLVYCAQYLGAARAEDAVQQAFMQSFVALRDGAHREIALRPWLYRIARNCSIDLLRKPGSDHDELDPDCDGMPQPPWLLEQKEELARIVAAIQALPEGQRRAITLRELEGRSYGEISAALGHTDSGVRQLIFRARTALRNLAGFAFPLGSLRWRLLGQPTVAPGDPHQLAAAANLSAGGGGILETAGSVLAATVTLAAGGGVAVAHHHATQVQGVPSAALVQPGAVQPLSAYFAHPGLRDGRHRTGGQAPVAASAPTLVAGSPQPIVVPVQPPALTAPTVPAPAPVPASGVLDCGARSRLVP